MGAETVGDVHEWYQVPTNVVVLVMRPCHLPDTYSSTKS